MCKKNLTFSIFLLFFAALLYTPILAQTKKSIPTIENRHREPDGETDDTPNFMSGDYTRLSSNVDIKCTFCQKGIATGAVYVSCKNCKDWADSYRNIKGCDVCKNNKYITIYKKGSCNQCGGTGIDPKAKKILLEQKLYKLLGVNPTFQSFTCAKPYSGVKVEFSPEMLSMAAEKYSRSEFVASLIKSDQSDSNVYFLLACIMTGDRKYSVVKNKLLAMLDYYKHKASLYSGCSGDVEAIKAIKLELAKLDKNSSYKPKLLGKLSAEDILLFF
jgi:hypothetical protein